MLTLLRCKLEEPNEIIGALRFFQAQRPVIPHNLKIMDIVGTGGDGAQTLNISTAASLVAASCGIPVAKHGGKSATSEAGSHDVFTEMGLQYAMDHQEAIDQLMRHSYTYLPASHFNPGLKHFATLRKNIGIPTLFNLVGPLLNPLQPNVMVLGVYRQDLLVKMAQVIQSIGIKRALVVHSHDGLDEISPSATTDVIEVDQRSLRAYTINPSDFGLQKQNLDCIKGSNAKDNAKRLQSILTQSHSDSARDCIAMNAGAALYVYGKSTSIREGFHLARQAILYGKTANLINLIQG